MGDRAIVRGSVDGRPRSVRTDDGLVVTSFLLRTRADGAARIRLPRGASPGCFLVTVIGEPALDMSNSLCDGATVTVAGAIVLRESSDPPHVLAELHGDLVDVDRESRVHPASVERPGGRAFLS
ncbi:hypothetical protein CLV49_3374 [Labedella gwakjiensis]|uniref:Single-strand DNA-binding protein n=1 Tax=Labedella gwakjiensis TaxID=390269 RepID=A0A2P8H0H5_9MICO|nr:hypothetical protein [Labedella gwakjiensis]PSL39727.1 hypothetical protein CLV49_3374 [Labedella gwakjiensis]